jgi:hypothetical protein
MKYKYDREIKMKKIYLVTGNNVKIERLEKK